MMHSFLLKHSSISSRKGTGCDDDHYSSLLDDGSSMQLVLVMHYFFWSTLCVSWRKGTWFPGHYFPSLAIINRWVLPHTVYNKQFHIHFLLHFCMVSEIERSTGIANYQNYHSLAYISPLAPIIATFKVSFCKFYNL